MIQKPRLGRYGMPASEREAQKAEAGARGVQRQLVGRHGFYPGLLLQHMVALIPARYPPYISYSWLHSKGYAQTAKDPKF